MTIKWKEPAMPRHVVQMLVRDLENRVLVMHRSENVKSAPNVWSIPSGEHEIGESCAAAVARELEEEYGFEEIRQLRQMFMYENIAGDTEGKDQYHWVITVFDVLVDDVTKAINREPEKHDELEFVKLSIFLYNDAWKKDHVFHPSLDNILIGNCRRHFEIK